MHLFYQAINELLSAQTPFVSVTLVHTTGSVPQQTGAKMLVTDRGLHFGTVGGGKVEQKALDIAKQMLANKLQNDTGYYEWNLRHDIGMTCGGNVTFYFERVCTPKWQIVVFGAGHVAQALIRILITLQCQILCIDPREDWLERLPQSSKLSIRQVANMPDVVEELPDGAYISLVTMGHSTDKPILLEILRQRERFSYVGVIGSRSKAVQLRQDIQDAGLPEECKEQFYCPVGLSIGNNQPEEIAVSIVAQLLQERDHLKARLDRQDKRE